MRLPNPRVWWEVKTNVNRLLFVVSYCHFAFKAPTFTFPSVLLSCLLLMQHEVNCGTTFSQPHSISFEKNVRPNANSHVFSYIDFAPTIASGLIHFDIPHFSTLVNSAHVCEENAGVGWAAESSVWLDSATSVSLQDDDAHPHRARLLFYFLMERVK